MITELGKGLRKLRIDLGMNMMAMATALGVSTAMLSAIETGRKRVPGDFIDRLVRAFPQLRSEKQTYEALINLANKEARITLEKATTEDAELVTELARRFSDLTPEKKAKLRNLLK